MFLCFNFLKRKIEEEETAVKKTKVAHEGKPEPAQKKVKKLCYC